ncbi:unnamed protein product [Phytophthora fragariaefolia]|uniref:Unnamed protein product n=1 Tax=Phytophthora fragariaefolia TaxID=1490495 RepID=A0A9W6XKM0_9STRA|nr:unnamed protein product [Phytophthora fragariaefolia]
MDADDATAPSDSEASQRLTLSRWSRWSQSHRQSLPDAPLEVAAVAAVPEAAPIQEHESAAPSAAPSAASASMRSASVSVRSASAVSASASARSAASHADEPPAKKAKKVWEIGRKDKKKPKPQAKASPTDPSELLLAAESADEEPARVSFLFFGGSDVDSTFTPELRPSELDDLHENEIRPSLQVKMPPFFSPPLVENMRRSSILPDPKEYEF